MTLSLVRPSLSTASCKLSKAAAAELALSYFTYATAHPQRRQSPQMTESKASLHSGAHARSALHVTILLQCVMAARSCTSFVTQKFNALQMAKGLEGLCKELLLQCAKVPE